MKMKIFENSAKFCVWSKLILGSRRGKINILSSVLPYKLHGKSNFAFYKKPTIASVYHNKIMESG